MKKITLSIALSILIASLASAQIQSITSESAFYHMHLDEAEQLLWIAKKNKLTAYELQILKKKLSFSPYGHAIIWAKNTKKESRIKSSTGDADKHQNQLPRVEYRLKVIAYDLSNGSSQLFNAVDKETQWIHQIVLSTSNNPFYLGESKSPKY